MRDWTWPAVSVIGIVVAAIVILFGLADDQPTRDHLIGYLDSIVPFVVGGTVGAVTGSVVGFSRGVKSVRTQMAPKGEQTPE